VLLAAASDAIVIAFHVPTESKAREVAARDGVDIRNYEVIYEVFEELRSALSGLLAPELQEHVIGNVEIRQIFSSSRDGRIGGCYVQSGKITRNNKVRVVRHGEPVFEGGVASLRRFKDDVREVLEGFECGVAVAGFDDIAEGDSLEVLEVVESARSL
jgi:translation initiation factor IF-2